MAEGLPHVKTPLAISKVTQESIAKVVQDPSAYGAHSVDACADQGRDVTTGLQDLNTSDAHGVDTCMGRGRGVAKIAARGGGEKVASASKGVGIEVVVEKAAGDSDGVERRAAMVGSRREITKYTGRSLYDLEWSQVETL